MACTLTTGFALDCADNIGGIEEILITNLENVTAITVVDGEITTITQAASTDFYRYELEQEDADALTTETKSVENGTVFFETVLNFTMDKLTKEKSEELKLLATARKLAIIYKLASGGYNAIGFDRGAMKVGGTNQAATGKAYGDKQGYTLGFTSKETHYPYFVDATVVSGLTIG